MKPTPTASRATPSLRQWMHASLCDLDPESAILALGCEEAFHAPQLTEYAASVTVLDTSGAQMGQLARRFPEISFGRHDPSSPLPFANASFDAVWCCDVLDRVFEPRLALQELLRVLTPGGRLLVTVPGLGPVRHVLRALFRRDETEAATIPHVRDFTARSLRKLARDAGFVEVQIRSAGGGLSGGEAHHLLLKARKGRIAPPVKLRRRTRGTGVALEQVEEAMFVSRGRAA